MAENGSTRVLIVEDSETTASLLRRLLTYSGFSVVEARSYEEAVARTDENRIDIALLNGEMFEVDEIEAARQLQYALDMPTLPILVLTTKEHIPGIMASFDNGLVEYLTRPFGAGDLIYRIQGLLSRRASFTDETDDLLEMVEPVPQKTPIRSRGGYVLAGFGTKGGVGKTMIATNLALALQRRRDRRVVLFDADFFFGDVSIHLSLPASRTLVDLLPQIDTLDEYAESALVRHHSGLFTLLGPPHPEDAERITPEHVRKILDWLRDRFDFIIVDCPPAYDERVLTVLDDADGILLVVTPEIGPLKNMSQFLDLADSLGFTQDKIYVVLNRADSNVGIEARMIERTVQHKVGFRIASGGRAVVLSVNRGNPILLDSPRHEVARQITQIADFFAAQV